MMFPLKTRTSATIMYVLTTRATSPFLGVLRGSANRASLPLDSVWSRSPDEAYAYPHVPQLGHELWVRAICPDSKAYLARAGLDVSRRVRC